LAAPYSSERRCDVLSVYKSLTTGPLKGFRSKREFQEGISVRLDDTFTGKWNSPVAQNGNASTRRICARHTELQCKSLIKNYNVAPCHALKRFFCQRASCFNPTANFVSSIRERSLSTVAGKYNNKLPSDMPARMPVNSCSL